MKPPFQMSPDPLPKAGKDKNTWSLVYNNKPSIWPTIDTMSILKMGRTFSDACHQPSDFKDVVFLECDVSPEEKAIMENWVVGNRFPLKHTGVYVHSGIPPAIRSRGHLGRVYDNPDPSIFRGAFISDGKYFDFLQSLQEGKYEVALEDFHQHTHQEIVDILDGRIKLTKAGVEVNRGSFIKDRLEKQLRKYPESQLFGSPPLPDENPHQLKPKLLPSKEGD